MKTATRRGNRAKRKDELAARTSISMPPPIMDIGRQNMRMKSFGSFSDYVEDLIRNDRRSLIGSGHGMTMAGA